MKLDVKTFELDGALKNFMIIHPSTAESLDLSPGTLVKVDETEQGFQIIVSPYVEQNVAGISTESLATLGIAPGNRISFRPTGVEGVSRIIRKKMKNLALSKEEIEIFISAIDKGLLTDGHVASFGTATEINHLSSDETTYVAEAILKYSKKMEHKRHPVVDKHSIGGIAGNRITPIMVPIIASAGQTIPKISTRAITSPAGTVDVLETVMPAELTLEEASETVAKTGGCMVSGERLELGATADKFLRVVKQIKIDPPEMMIASILSKKKAAGSQYVLIDLPTGKGAKLEDRENARKLAYRFSTIGNKLGLKIDSVVSPGDQPIGSMIGPALEMKEALMILQQEGGAHSLRRKALSLSGLIFEMIGKANRGEGYTIAKDILKSGKAYEKFLEISTAQGGPEMVKFTDLPEANYTHTIKGEGGDKVYSINSYNVGLIARAAGAPKEKTAGVTLHVDRGSVISDGDPLLTIHASTENEIDEAIALLQTAQPIAMERSILEHISGPIE